MQMAKFAQENGFTVDVLVARATGAWEGRHEVLIDGRMTRSSSAGLHERYPVIHRDTFPSYGMDKGAGVSTRRCTSPSTGTSCRACTSTSPSGTSSRRAWPTSSSAGRASRASGSSSACLSGEDRGFIDKYMTKFYGKPLPMHWSKAFGPEDFVAPEQTKERRTDTGRNGPARRAAAWRRGLFTRRRREGPGYDSLHAAEGPRGYRTCATSSPLEKPFHPGR